VLFKVSPEVRVAFWTDAAKGQISFPARELPEGLWKHVLGVWERTITCHRAVEALGHVPHDELNRAPFRSDF
jgi:hypothetical protein